MHTNIPLRSQIRQYSLYDTCHVNSAFCLGFLKYFKISQFINFQTSRVWYVDISQASLWYVNRKIDWKKKIGRLRFRSSFWRSAAACCVTCLQRGLSSCVARRGTRRKSCKKAGGFAEEQDGKEGEFVHADCFGLQPSEYAHSCMNNSGIINSFVGILSISE